VSVYGHEHFGDHVSVFVSAFEITYLQTDTNTNIFEITCPCSCPLLKSRIRNGYEHGHPKFYVSHNGHGYGHPDFFM